MIIRNIFCTATLGLASLIHAASGDEQHEQNNTPKVIKVANENKKLTWEEEQEIQKQVTSLKDVTEKSNDLLKMWAGILSYFLILIISSYLYFSFDEDTNSSLFHLGEFLRGSILSFTLLNFGYILGYI